MQKTTINKVPNKYKYIYNDINVGTSIFLKNPDEYPAALEYSINHYNRDDKTYSITDHYYGNERFISSSKIVYYNK